MEVIATDVGDMATQVLPVYIKTNVVIIVRRRGISAQCVVKRRVRQPRQLPRVRTRSLVNSEKPTWWMYKLTVTVLVMRLLIRATITSTTVAVMDA